MNYLHGLQSEMLKTRRTAAVWLSIVGGFFIPLIYVFYAFHQGASINSNLGKGVNIWQGHFAWCWQNMASFLLPVGIILSSSLITQMEFKNNTWKQLHTTPQSYSLIFLAKFSAILLLTVQFFLFFTIGIVISGLIPCLVLDGNFSSEGIPLMFFLKETIKYFIACLPILALQYLMSLRFKNFLVPIGVGLVLLIGTLIANSWQHVYLSPFSFPILRLFPMREFPTGISAPVMALVYFVLIMSLSFYMYIRRKEKG